MTQTHEAKRTPTPGPWRVKNSKLLIGADYRRVDAQGSFKPEDAAHIVHCVNTHDALVEALQHCLKVFRSMSDRGAYPQELLPFDLYDQTKESPLFLGKQGYHFIIEALALAEKGA